MCCVLCVVCSCIEPLVKLRDKMGLTMRDEDIGSFVTKVGGGHPSKDAIRTGVQSQTLCQETDRHTSRQTDR